MGAHGSARDRRTGRLSLRSGRVKRRSGGSITPGMLIRLTTLAGLGDDPQTTEEERYRLTIARFGALVFVGDAALIFAAWSASRAASAQASTRATREQPPSS